MSRAGTGRWGWVPGALVGRAICLTRNVAEMGMEPVWEGAVWAGCPRRNEGVGAAGSGKASNHRSGGRQPQLLLLASLARAPPTHFSLISYLLPPMFVRYPCLCSTLPDLDLMCTIWEDLAISASNKSSDQVVGNSLAELFAYARKVRPDLLILVLLYSFSPSSN